jgi:DNA-binding MarR family transcriptional regulator
MRYSPIKWGSIAVLMRNSTYSTLEALVEKPKGWKELKEAAGLTDGGLQKILRELIKMNVIEEILAENPYGLKQKKYAITAKAKKEQVYEKAKELKESLERVAKR